MTVRLTLYGRPGCHLCDEARRTIEDSAEGLGVSVNVEERNIEDDDHLLATFLERIPVVEHEGRTWFELEIEPARLRAMLEEAASIP